MIYGSASPRTPPPSPIRRSRSTSPARRIAATTKRSRRGFRRITGSRRRRRGRMKGAYEAALAREAFARQRVALETIAEVAFERLKQAADLIAEHVRAVAAAIRLRADAVGSAEPQPPSPPSPSPHGPSL